MIQKRIEWVDHSLNLWWGCSMVNASCKNCTAIDFSKRLLKEDIFNDESPRRVVRNFMSDLKQIERYGKRKGEKVVVLIGSMMDIFEESRPLIDGSTGKPMYKDMLQTDEVTTGDLRAELFKGIENGNFNNVVFMFLTKRPENIGKSIPKAWKTNHPANVWFGISASEQRTLNSMTGKLIKQFNQDANLFLNIEPQTKEIDIFNMKGIECIKYVLQGGETGSNRRPFQIEWAYKIQKSCESLSIKYFFKQWDKVHKDPKDLKKERII